MYHIVCSFALRIVIHLQLPIVLCPALLTKGGLSRYERVYYSGLRPALHGIGSTTKSFESRTTLTIKYMCKVGLLLYYTGDGVGFKLLVVCPLLAVNVCI